MYEVIVTLTINKKEENYNEFFDNFKDAYKAAHLLSACLTQNWTRPNSVTGLIKHLDMYLNMFNEGTIEIIKQ